MTTSTNERTHFFIKIYLSHYILKRVMFVVCEKWVGDKDELLYWPKLFLAHSSISFASWIGFLNRGSLRAAKPSVCSWSSLRHPVSNWLKPSGRLVISLFTVHLLLLFFFYTGVSLDWRLGRGSICNNYTYSLKAT